MVTWTVTPLEKDQSRLHDPLSGWESLTLVERFNKPDTWVLEGPAGSLDVLLPGSGCVLSRDGVQVTSGVVRSVSRSAEYNDDGRLEEKVTVGCASWWSLLAGRVVLPSRQHVLSRTVSKMTPAHDKRSGPAEDLILYYIRACMGDLALADRRVPRLGVPVSLGRGAATSVSARLDVLGELVASLAEGAGLRITMQHSEPGPVLQLRIDAVRDVSENIRFGSVGSTAVGLMAEWSYSLEEPTVTRAIVAGGGEATERVFLQVASPEAEQMWGRATEVLVDQRQSDTSVELVRAGEEEIAKGASPVKVSFTPILGPDIEFRRDVRVGDVVGYDLPGLPPGKDIVREATTVVQRTDGDPIESVSLVVGSPDAPQARSAQQVSSALRGVAAIQRSA